MDTDGKVAQLEALLRQGVTKKQLVASGFAESTVRKALKRLEKKGEPVPAVMSRDRLPRKQHPPLPNTLNRLNHGFRLVQTPCNL